VEQVKAVVQLVDPAMASPDKAAELIAHCRARLASVKCPRSVDFADALPRDPNGKLLKRMLRGPY
jgi:long-chain acyl-CoA synthetase